MGDLFVKTLFIQYLAVAGAYAFGGQWWKVLYFVSAAGISIAVLRMKG